MCWLTLWVVFFCSVFRYIMGGHVAEYAGELQEEEPEKYEQLFSTYIDKEIEVREKGPIRVYCFCMNWDFWDTYLCCMNLGNLPLFTRPFPFVAG